MTFGNVITSPSANLFANCSGRTYLQKLVWGREISSEFRVGNISAKFKIMSNYFFFKNHILTSPIPEFSQKIYLMYRGGGDIWKMSNCFWSLFGGGISYIGIFKKIFKNTCRDVVGFIYLQIQFMATIFFC